MIIGVDVRVLANPHRSGVEEYTDQLLANLVRLYPNVEFKLFFSSWRQKLVVRPWMHARNVRMYVYRVPNIILLIQTLLRRITVDTWMGGVDVFFSPHPLPVGLSPSCPRVVTFHDLAYERFPEFFSLAHRWWHRVIQPRQQAQSAARIIAVSHSTKADLREYYGVDDARITVIHSGCVVPDVPTDEATVTAVRSKYRIPENYFLYVGTWEPRKNILGLIRAFETVCERGNCRDVSLVIAGHPGWLYSEIERAAARSKWCHRISLVRTVTEDERTALYRSARAFVYPSFFEGFGFPPLEAMAQGAPVIVSAFSSLPEVVGDAGMLVHPHQLETLVHAMEVMVTDPSVHHEYSVRARQRVGQFAWERTARETFAALISTP